MGPKVLKGGPTKTMKYIITIKKKKNGHGGAQAPLDPHLSLSLPSTQYYQIIIIFLKFCYIFEFLFLWVCLLIK